MKIKPPPVHLPRASPARLRYHRAPHQGSHRALPMLSGQKALTSAIAFATLVLSSLLFVYDNGAMRRFGEERNANQHVIAFAENHKSRRNEQLLRLHEQQQHNHNHPAHAEPSDNKFPIEIRTDLRRPERDEASSPVIHGDGVIKRHEGNRNINEHVIARTENGISRRNEQVSHDVHEHNNDPAHVDSFEKDISRRNEQVLHLHEESKARVHAKPSDNNFFIQNHTNNPPPESDEASSPNDKSQQPTQEHRKQKQFTISPGELPGYTGWARPEQTLAGYFDIDPLSHPAMPERTKYHSVVESGDKFSLLLTCNPHESIDDVDAIADEGSDPHNNTDDSDTEYEPAYVCPPDGGSLFYVRAYGPAVVTGLVTDHMNASYSVEIQFVDPGDYTLEVVVTFSVPLEYDEFPVDRGQNLTAEEKVIEPGYEGYMVSGFPLSVRVDPAQEPSSDGRKPWCTVAQLTETSPQTALFKGHWQVIDHVARSSHQPMTPDETAVSLDGYRMGINSVGVRMRYVYEDCELIHIRDIAGAISGGLDGCLREQLGLNISQPDVAVGPDLLRGNLTDGSAYASQSHDNGIETPDRTLGSTNFLSGLVDLLWGKRTDADAITSQKHDNATDASDHTLESANFEEGVHVIFIGDSVMKLVMRFFEKLVHGSIGFKMTFIDTHGGIHPTLPDITSTLEKIQRTEHDKNIKRFIYVNTGLHDIDILCSSKRKDKRNTTAMGNISCVDAYREALVQLVNVLEDHPAELKVYGSTTAGWQKPFHVPNQYGNYGFSWRANNMQPMSRSPHLCHHFNTIAFDVIREQSNSILMTDGYWMTLPRPDHTQTSLSNQGGKHLVHPGYEVLSVFARRWFMLIMWGLYKDSFPSCMRCIGGVSK